MTFLPSLAAEASAFRRSETSLASRVRRTSAKFGDLIHLPAVVVLVELDFLLAAGDVLVHAHLDEFAVLDAHLPLVGLAGQLPAHETVLHTGEHAAPGLDLLHLLPDLVFHLLGDGLHEVGAGQRIHGVTQAHFLHDDLQGAQGEQRRALGGDAVGLVEGAERRGLGAGEGGGQTVESAAHDVVLRFGLHETRAAAGEQALQHEVGVLGDAVALAQVGGPDLATGAELGHLLPHVAVDVQVVADAAGEGIGVVATLHHFVDVGVGDQEGVGHLLGGGGAGSRGCGSRRRTPDRCGAAR